MHIHQNTTLKNTPRVLISLDSAVIYLRVHSVVGLALRPLISYYVTVKRGGLAAYKLTSWVSSADTTRARLTAVLATAEPLSQAGHNCIFTEVLE